MTTPQIDKLTAFVEDDRLVGGVFGAQFDAAALRVEAFHRHLAVDHSHDDTPVARLLRAIDNENIAVKEAGVHHGVARQAHIEGRSRMLDQELVEIELAFEIVIGRRRKSRRDPRQKKGQSPRNPPRGPVDMSIPLKTAFLTMRTYQERLARLPREGKHR